jgi:hypothetical protein
MTKPQSTAPLSSLGWLTLWPLSPACQVRPPWQAATQPQELYLQALRAFNLTACQPATGVTPPPGKGDILPFHTPWFASQSELVSRLVLPVRPWFFSCHPSRFRHPRKGKRRQDRGEGSVARPLRDLPAGRRSGAAEAVRGHSGADRPAAAGVCLGATLVAPDTWVRPSSPCVQGRPGDDVWGEPRSRVLCDRLRPRRGGCRLRGCSD